MSVVRITDPTAVGDTIEVLDQDIVSLDTPTFDVRRITVPFAECCLLHQWTSVRLRTRTTVHPAFDSVTVLGPDAHGSIDGIELVPFSIIAAATGASAEIIVNGGYSSIALMVPPQVLERHLALRQGRTGFKVTDNAAVWHPDIATSRSLYELGERIAREAEKLPAIFDDNPAARHGAQVEFMDSLLPTLETCGAAPASAADRKGQSYSQIVKACEEYTMKVDGHRPYVSELCEVAHVSERTLQYAFQEIMGMSPVTFLHRLRLHRARNELRNASSSSTTVTTVAMNWGFWHFGAFSKAYKECFGEVPSKTLRRPPTD